jgi:hypothetical protein
VDESIIPPGRAVVNQERSRKIKIGPRAVDKVSGTLHRGFQTQFRSVGRILQPGVDDLGASPIQETGQANLYALAAGKALPETITSKNSII